VADIDITGLKSLVTKLRYADDELIDPVATEVAKFLELHGTCRDTLTALVERGPLFDGDVPSKMERDVLLEVGLCVKVCCNGEDGYNAASQLAWWVLKAWKSLTVDQKVDPLGNDGVIGDTGNAEVSTEALVDQVDVEFLWDALATQFHSIPDKTIYINRQAIERYGELLGSTYCDPDWVKRQDPSLSELEVAHTTYDAKMLQFHCLSLIKLDPECLTPEFTNNALIYGRTLHDKLYDCVG